MRVARSIIGLVALSSLGALSLSLGDTAKASVDVGNTCVHVVVEQGSCTYFPTTTTGHLSVSGVGVATVVCSGGGAAELVGTGGSQSTTFGRVVADGLAPCVLTWVGVAPFSAGAD